MGKKSNLRNESLIKASTEIISGLIDAELGFHLLKKRIPIGTKGKRGGARVILAYREKETIFFLYGFEKNQKDNVEMKELRQLKIISESLLKLNNKEIEMALKAKELIELG